MAKLTPPPARQDVSEAPAPASVSVPAKRVSNTQSVGKAVAQAKPKAPTEQTPPDEIAPLQLKIPKYKRNEFKAYAAMRGIPMNDLFLDMFELYKQNNT
jgi:hypothetical protein